jgi:hypothetical protein
MTNFLKATLCILIMAMILIPTKGQAQCDVRSFMVNNITSVQKSSETELAFVLTASKEEYEKAKTDLSHSGSWLGGYGLFDDKGTYEQAQDKARKIAQAINFDYSNSYASSYFTQQVSGAALDAYVQCLNRNAPGLQMWLSGRTGDFFKYEAFWVGANTTQGVGKLEGKPTYSGVEVVSLPDTWVKGNAQNIVLKRTGNVDFYFGLKVAGQNNAVFAVKDPPNVKWSTATVASARPLSASSHGTGENCSGGQDSDCIYPTHPAGHFVAGTRTTNVKSSDPGHYGEKFDPDRPDQICVKITQSTGDCQQTGVASGRLQAIETYPEAAQ